MFLNTTNMKPSLSPSPEVQRLLDRSEGKLSVELETDEMDGLRKMAASAKTEIDPLFRKTIEQLGIAYIPDRGILYKGSDENTPHSPKVILAIIAQMRKGIDWTVQLPSIQQK